MEGWNHQYYKAREFIGQGFSPWGSRKCVINLLRLLIEDPQAIVFLNRGEYQFTGIQVSEEGIIHPPERVLQPEALLTSKSRLNFGLKTLKDVRVLPKEIPAAPKHAEIWRSYVIIRDGEKLNVSSLKTTLSEGSFELLKLAGAITGQEKYRPTSIYEIRLKGMPLVSLNWARPIELGLLSLMKEEKELAAQQTAVNKLLKTFPQPEKEKVEREAEEAEEAYEVPFVEYDLPDYRPEKYDFSGCGLDYEAALAKKEGIARRLRQVRNIIRTIKFACEQAQKQGRQVVKWEQAPLNPRRRISKDEKIATLNGTLLRRVSWNRVVARTAQKPV